MTARMHEAHNERLIMVLQLAESSTSSVGGHGLTEPPLVNGWVRLVQVFLVEGRGTTIMSMAVGEGTQKLSHMN